MQRSRLRSPFAAAKGSHSSCWLLWACVADTTDGVAGICFQPNEHFAQSFTLCAARRLVAANRRLEHRRRGGLDPSSRGWQLRVGSGSLSCSRCTHVTSSQPPHTTKSSSSWATTRRSITDLHRTAHSHLLVTEAKSSTLIPTKTTGNAGSNSTCDNFSKRTRSHLR